MNVVDTSAFLKFWSLGYKRLIPIIPPDATISPRSSLAKRINTHQDARGKSPGVKGRDSEWFGFDWINCEADSDDLARWQHMGAGTGIKTGAIDPENPKAGYLVAIDADTLNADHARTIRDIVEDQFGRLPVRIGRYPKALYLIRTTEAVPYMRVEFGEPDGRGVKERVELLSDGRQFVAHGIHPGTKQPYEWPRGIPALDDLPVIDKHMLDPLLADLRAALPEASKTITEGATTAVNQQALKGSLQAVTKAVNAIPNTSAHFPSRESYRDFGYAIKAALPDYPDEAFDLFADWCARWDEGTNDLDIVAADWRRMKPPFRIGAGYIYELAETLAPDKFSIAEPWFDNIDELPLNPFQEVAQKEAEAAKAETKKFTFLPFDEAADGGIGNDTPPLIKGLIDQGAMSVLYGDSNVGKTFVAMDLAYHVAAGLPYNGLKTEHATVVYVAAEGGRGAKRRLTALRDKYRPPSENLPKFFLLPSPVDLRRPDADLAPFIAALRAFGAPIGLLVIDTLSRALAGGDENSSVDMGAIVKHFDAIRSAVGAHLMIVHHTGKNKAAGARGHSLLRAATDTEIEVDEGLVRVTKQRDLDKSWQSAFALEVRKLGLDEDGDPVTSCTVRLMSASDVAKTKDKAPLTVTEERVLDALSDMVVGSSLGANGVTVEQLLAGSRDTLSDITAEKARFHLRSLHQKGHVVRPKRGFWGFETEENASSVSDPKRSVKSETEESGEVTYFDIFE